MTQRDWRIHPQPERANPFPARRRCHRADPLRQRALGHPTPGQHLDFRPSLNAGEEVNCQHAKHRTTCSEAALNGFALAFDGRLSAGHRQLHPTGPRRSLDRPDQIEGRLLRVASGNDREHFAGAHPVIGSTALQAQTGPVPGGVLDLVLGVAASRRGLAPVMGGGHAEAVLHRSAKAVSDAG